MKVFDAERAAYLKCECDKIFGEGNFISEAGEKNGVPCLRIIYDGKKVDFKCYKLC